MSDAKQVPPKRVRKSRTTDAPAPQDVLIVPEQEPIPVTFESDELKGAAALAGEKNGKEKYNKPIVPIQKSEGLTLPPTTTEQDDMVTAGQRNINLIWETTQSRIALLVVFAGVLLNSIIVILVVFLDHQVDVTQMALISICLQFMNLTVGVVIGFYFSRTNHSASGGVGPKPVQEAYTGR